MGKRVIFVFLLLCGLTQGAVIDELRLLKELPIPTYVWATPNGANPDEVVELGRICGSVGTMAEDGPAKIAVAVAVAAKAQLKRLPASKPVALSVVWRPWLTASAPESIEAWSEFGRSHGQAKAIADVLKASAYKPALVCLIDTESFDARTEPNRSKVAQLYAAYDAMLRAAGCTEVHWYGWGQVPAPANPDEWGQHAFVVPFAGLQNIGFEIYYVGEHMGKRQSSHRARAYATSLGIANTTAWIAAPGSGREYRFAPTYSEWTWDTGPKTHYDSELGRELYGSWYRARPLRFMDAVNAVCCYPHPFDPRIVDPERKHLLSFLRGAVE